MSEVKFREFWIRFRIGDNESTHQITDVSLNPLGPYKEDFHVIECGALAAKDVEIIQIKSELAEKDAVLADIARQGYGYQGYYEEDDYKGLAEHATREHLNNQDKAREVLQKYKSEG